LSIAIKGGGRAFKMRTSKLFVQIKIRKIGSRRERQQKNILERGAAEKKRSKNSTIKPLPGEGATEKKTQK